MIPDEDWATIVDSMPVPSVDLVVVNGDGEFLLGKRENKPARGTWFVPGGRVLKNESLENAVHRLARQEIGLSVEIEDELGYYEHFYALSDTESDTGKHYIPVAYVVSVDGTQAVESDDQHGSLRWFSSVPKYTHNYTTDYLRDAGLV